MLPERYQTYLTTQLNMAQYLIISIRSSWETENFAQDLIIFDFEEDKNESSEKS